MAKVQLENIKEFVKNAKKEKDIDVYNIGDLKKVLNKAIEHFSINAKIDFYEDDFDAFDYIKLYDIQDEELLEKVLELVIGDGDSCSLAYIFEGNLVREY